MSLVEFRYEVHDGHVLFEVDGVRVLLDTGAPATVGRNATWRFQDKQWHIETSYVGVDVDALSSMVGTRVDVLLGADILRGYTVTLASARSVIAFGMTPASSQALLRLPFKPVMGVPSVQGHIDGRAVRMFFDTGAKLSYLARDLLVGYPTLGRERDFYPGIGDFEVVLHAVRLELEGGTCELECAALPEPLEATLLVAGVEGIIGSELLNSYEVCLDYPRAEMFLTRR